MACFHLEGVNHRARLRVRCTASLKENVAVDLSLLKLGHRVVRNQKACCNDKRLQRARCKAQVPLDGLGCNAGHVEQVEVRNHFAGATDAVHGNVGKQVQPKQVQVRNMVVGVRQLVDGVVGKQVAVGEVDREKR